MMFIYTHFLKFRMHQIKNAMTSSLCSLRTRLLKVLLLLCVLSSAACQTVDTQYRWGIYEEQVYADYVEPGGRTPQDAAQMLQTDITTTLDSGQRVPPGVYAHLGYLYYLTGNTQTARGLFEKEREEFPESSVFVDTLLSNLQGANK